MFYCLELLCDNLDTANTNELNFYQLLHRYYMPYGWKTAALFAQYYFYGGLMNQSYIVTCSVVLVYYI